MKPSWRNRQEGGGEGRSSSCTRPRNRARICLDGDHGRDAVPSFREGILSIFAWCRANGIVMDVSSIFGSGVEIVTTPHRGTFHLELEFRERWLEVVIRGRDLYVKGWRSPNGSFEIKEIPTKDKKTTKGKKKEKKRSEEPKNYMVGEDVKPVEIGFNHADLAPNREVGDTMMGIHEFRRAFDALFEYKGGSPGRSVREAVGKIAVFISESTRFPFVEEITCRSFIHDSVSRLRQAEPETEILWLQRWDHCSNELMQYIDCVLCGEAPPLFNPRGLNIQSVAEIVPMVRVLYIGAYSKGRFARDPPPKVLGSQGWKHSHIKMEPDIEEPIDPPLQMEGGKKKNIIKEKHYHGKGGKISNKQVKGDARGPATSASSPRSSSHRRYRTESISCSSPSLDSCRQSLEETNNACKSLTTLSRGYGGSTLSHLGAAQRSSSIPCSSAPPSTSQQDNWLQYVEANQNVGKFLGSLSKGCGRTSLVHLGLPVSDLRIHFPSLRKLCGLSYEMRRRQRILIDSSAARTSSSAKQQDAEPLRTTFAKLFKVKRSSKTRLWSLLPTAWTKRNQPTVLATQLLQTRSVPLETQLIPKKAQIQWAGAWMSKVLRRLRR